MIRIAFLICSILLLAACNPPPNDSEATDRREPLVLEVYPVSRGMADQIESSLGFLLSGDEVGSSRVRTLPNGHIAVSAPASMQPGIATLIEQISESGPVVKRQVRIRQWLIQGAPAEETTIPSNLASLEAELRDFASSAGDMAFERLDTAQHIMLDGKRSNVSSKLLNSSLRTRIEGDRVLVDINTRAPMLGRLDTEFSAAPGQSLVMAKLEKPGNEGQESDKIVIFVIQANIL